MKSVWVRWGQGGCRAEVDPKSRWEAVTGVQKADDEKAWLDSKYIWKQSWQARVWGGAAAPSLFGTREQFSGRQFFPLMGWGARGMIQAVLWAMGRAGEALPPPPQPPAVRPQPWGDATPARREESRRTALSNCRSGHFPCQGKGVREGTLALSGWV